MVFGPEVTDPTPRKRQRAGESRRRERQALPGLGNKALPRPRWRCGRRVQESAACNRGGGLVPHAGKHVRVAVEGHSAGAVAEEFLHELGVDSPAQEQRGAGVAQVVETGLLR
jgi:hypothetical protein